MNYKESLWVFENNLVYKKGGGTEKDFEAIDNLQRLIDKEMMIRLQLTNAKIIDTDGKLKILENIERIVNGKSGEWEC